MDHRHSHPHVQHPSSKPRRPSRPPPPNKHAEHARTRHLPGAVAPATGLDLPAQALGREVPQAAPRPAPPLQLAVAQGVAQRRRRVLKPEGGQVLGQMMPHQQAPRQQLLQPEAQRGQRGRALPRAGRHAADVAPAGRLLGQPAFCGAGGGREGDGAGGEWAGKGVPNRKGANTIAITTATSAQRPADAPGGSAHPAGCRGCAAARGPRRPPRTLPQAG